MRLFDTHCHLDVAEFDPDRSEVLKTARAVGVSDLLIPATCRRLWQGLIALCGADPGLHPALGLHPVYLHEHADEDIEALGALVGANRPVAVGEIGLDFALKTLERERQLALLRSQLRIAEQYQLPVILHCRKAHDELLSALRDFDLPGGICHAFAGTEQQAGKYHDLGFKLGFGGMLTFERSRRLRGLAALLPLDQLVLETDAPDLTVASHQYQRNSPEYLPEVMRHLVAVRGESPGEIELALWVNSREALCLDAAGP